MDKTSLHIPNYTNEKCPADKSNALADREWEDLVKFWITEEHQVLSDSNISRSHQKAKHPNVKLKRCVHTFVGDYCHFSFLNFSSDLLK
ncbi:hypothetical protein C5167_010042 [Papaver somniferum]|uniref:Uncharacterized protein n=1 Tax=Papaver somniferum TaxID=3469 RepID=A0A4Y7K301_PAPSO|nr:hypothetical protein C5167_010042 [Papaver somniferum]